jgi:hypothetical protein
MTTTHQPANTTTQKTTTTTKQPTVVANQSTIPTSRPAISAHRLQLMKEGKCFYCKEPGHLAIHCPAKKQISDLKTLTLEHGPEMTTRNQESENDKA